MPIVMYKNHNILLGKIMHKTFFDAYFYVNSWRIYKLIKYTDT